MSKLPHNNEPHHDNTKPKHKGLITKAIIVLLGIGMAGFGTDSFGLGGSSPDHALEVNDIVMTRQQLQNIKASVKQQFPQLDDDKVDEITLMRGKSELALMNYLEESGFSVSDSQFAEQMKSIFIGADGKFDRALLDSYLYRSGQTLSQLKTQIAQDQLKQRIISSAIASESEIIPNIQMARPSRDVIAITIMPEKKFSDVKADAAEVKAYFESNASEFDLPEKIALSYIDLDKKTLSIDQNISDEELQLAFNSYKLENAKTEQRKSRYYLFGDKKEVADKLSHKLKSGEISWDEVNEKYASDIEDSGEFDYITKSAAPSPEIGEALFAIPNVGDTSPVIDSESGALIINLEDRTMADNPETLDEVKDKLSESILTSRRDEQYNTQLELLEDAAFDSAASFDLIVDSMKVAPQTTGLVEKGSGEGILALSEVQNKLVDDEGKIKSPNTYIEPIEVGEDRVIIIDISDYKPAESQEFEAVKQEVQSAANTKKREELANELAESLKASIEAGEPIEALAKSHELSIYNFEDLSFNNLPQGENLMLGIQIVQQPLRLGAENVQVIDSPLGGKILAVTTNVNLADDPSEQDLTATKNAIEQNNGQKELGSLVNSIVKETKFKIYNNTLAQ